MWEGVKQQNDHDWTSSKSKVLESHLRTLVLSFTNLITERRICNTYSHTTKKIWQSLEPTQSRLSLGRQQGDKMNLSSK